MKRCACGCGKFVKKGNKYLIHYSLLTKEIKMKNKARMEKLWKNKDFRGKQIKIIKNFCNSPEWKKKVSKRCLIRRLNPEIRDKIKNSKQFAYFLGALFGDGYIGPKAIEFYGLKDRGFTYAIVDSFKSCFDMDIKIKKGINSGSGNVCWSFRIYSVELTKYIKNITRNKKQVPIFIKNNSNLRRMFLRGFYDAEGTVVETGISISQLDYNLLNQIFDILMLEGIIPSSFKKYESISVINICYSVGIRKFKKKIGFNIKYKMNRIDSILNEKTKHRFSDIYWKTLRFFLVEKKQKEISELLKIERSLISKWVNGKSIPNSIRREFKYKIFPYDIEKLTEKYIFLQNLRGEKNGIHIINQSTPC